MYSPFAVVTHKRVPLRELFGTPFLQIKIQANDRNDINLESLPAVFLWIDLSAKASIIKRQNSMKRASIYSIEPSILRNPADRQNDSRHNFHGKRKNSKEFNRTILLKNFD